MTARTINSADRIRDPIAMEVFSNRLMSITEDMGTLLTRSSFSTNIKERKDCSVALFDCQGRLISQASHIPLHLGSLIGSVQATIREVAPETMRYGDAFISNDPYLAGGTHTPDIAVVTPVFVDGVLSFFAANVGHHSDLGGPIPGSISPSSPTLFHEGLRIPVIRIMAGHQIDTALLRLISENSREPEERTLDIRAQIATNNRGAKLLHALCARMGMDDVLTAIDDLLNHTRQHLERRLEKIPDGSASFSASLEDDGIGSEEISLCVKITISGKSLIADFEGSAPQTQGAMNVPESAIRATVAYAVKSLVDPELLPNSGMFDPIEIRLPEDSIVNPRFPAAVGARSITCNKVVRALFGALSQLLPTKCSMASSQDIVPGIIFSGTRRQSGREFVYLETVGGGMGAQYGADGMDGIHVHMTNTSNLPVESLEREYGLLVEQYSFVEDSGGAGKWRGGLGIARQIRALDDGIVFSARSDGHKRGAPGLLGGESGRPARLLMKSADRDWRELPSKVSNIALKSGDVVRLETPGGGGLGSPRERIPSEVENDVRSQKFTPEFCDRFY